MPESYPAEDIDKGFGVLGHIKRVQTPSMDKMLARDNKMYYINESANLDPSKEMKKMRGLFASTVGSYTSLANQTLSLSPAKTVTSKL